jgi:hypothetical protein
VLLEILACIIVELLTQAAVVQRLKLTRCVYSQISLRIYVIAAHKGDRQRKKSESS